MGMYKLSNDTPSNEGLFVEESTSKYYDLEERTFQYAQQVRDLVKKVTPSIWNKEYIKQVVRASASIGANYIEANDSLGDKDFLMRIKIARREAKEVKYWLRLLDLIDAAQLETDRDKLIKESEELRMILSSIHNKRLNNTK
jgi:four helix bundle protein